ncbi:hypothetical protein [Mucilaginibacter sp.]|uniref:hypothetical protein n=1 Tax=Mucilaginibacter sp. TaxID=1882438 RepID=UPI0035BC2DD5
MKKPIITLIALIVFCSNLATAQDLFVKRSSTIHAFISAVFKDKKDTRFIMDNYMYIAPNETIPKEKKETVVTAMIGKLTANSKILASSDYKIFEYDNFKGDKKIFNTDDYRDIMILSIKNKAIVYFYFKQDRLISFTYIDKGSLSFFVTI